MPRPTLPPGALAAPRPRGLAAGRLLPVALGAAWLAVAVPLLLWGLDYYATPLIERPFHPQDDLFRPTGLVGNRLGILGTAMIAFGVAMYLVRKRWRRLQGVGRLRTWLSVHIWLCTLGPFLILLHTSFKVGGIVSIAFWSMAVVVGSGVLGRYVYVHLPKADNGRFLEMREVEAAQRALREELAASGLSGASLDALAVPEPVRTPTPVQALGLALRAGLAGRRALAEAGAEAGEVAALARRYRRLALDRAVLVPFSRLFRYWHAFHLPLALVMAFVLLVHVAVAFLFGYAWTPSDP
jgi:hypothetical protein